VAALNSRLDSRAFRVLGAVSAELHDLLRKVAHPSVAGLDHELTFRVQQHAAGEYGQQLRTISLNGNVRVARAAFDAAVRCYPDECRFLLWGNHVVAKYAPDRRRPERGAWGRFALAPARWSDGRGQVDIDQSQTLPSRV
jgi:hypothetical protein